MNGLEKGRRTNEPVAANDKNFPHCVRHPVQRTSCSSYNCQVDDDRGMQTRTDVISNDSQNDARMTWLPEQARRDMFIYTE
jgi:hypothetical protein